MVQSRKEAIAAQHAQSQQGNAAKWYYVKMRELERLGITQWKPEAGDNMLRIIAQQDVDGFFLHEVFLHYKIGADGANVVCSQKMYNTPCPICELRASFLSEDPEDKKADALRYSARFLCFVVDTKNQETIKKGLRWFDAPGAFKKNILELSKNPRTGEFIDVSDPDEGGDILFVREGKMLQTKYLGFRILADSPPLAPEMYLATPKTFEEVIIIPEYDATLTLVSGQKYEPTTEERKQAANSAATSTGSSGSVAPSGTEATDVAAGVATAAANATSDPAPDAKKKEEIPFHEDTPPKQELLDPPPVVDKSNLSVAERIELLKKERAQQGGG